MNICDALIIFLMKNAKYQKHFLHDIFRRDWTCCKIKFMSYKEGFKGFPRKMSSEWKDLYGEVVWAKCPPFNWWPCYVYDPDKIPDTSQEVRKKAAKLSGKQYAVYFYGDTSYSFTVPKNIVPYNQESKAKFANVIPPKRYAAQFASGIEIADIEVALEKHERVNFHLQGSKTSACDESVGPKKKGRPRKSDGLVSNDELYFVEPDGQKKGTMRSNDGTRSDNEADEKQSENEGNISGKSAKDKKKVPVPAKRGRGRPRLHPLPEQEGYQQKREEDAASHSSSDRIEDGDEDEEEGEGEEDSAASDEEDDEEEEEIVIRPSAKRRRTGGDKHGESVAVSLSASRTARSAVSASGASSSTGSNSNQINQASSGGSSSAFAGESPVDRLVRFGKILAICTAAAPTDEGGHRDIARAVKLLDKLASVEVSSAELVKSGIGKIITELRRSPEERISSRAQALRAKWKAIVQKEGPAPVSTSSVSTGGESNGSNGTSRALVGSSLLEDNAMETTFPLRKGVALKTATDAGGLAALNVLPSSATAVAAVTPLTLTLSQSQARARAVRLLREATAATSASSASSVPTTITTTISTTNFSNGVAEYGNLEANISTKMNSGELAFAAEKLAMEILGGPSQPRYLEFITRLAAKLKNGSVSFASSDALHSYLIGFDFVSSG